MKLIDKDALVAEINRLIAELVEKGEGTMFEQGRISAFEDAKLFLDSLEVKKVDLEKAIDDYIYTHDSRKRLALELDWKCCNLTLKGGNEIIKFAKHFFELGLKVSQPVISAYGIEEALKENGIDTDSKEADMYREAIYKIYDRLQAQKGEEV